MKENHMSDIKVRELQVKDLFTIAKLLGKIAKGARGELLMVITGKSKEISPANLGLTLFQVLFTEAEEDLKKWLADMAGLESVAKFDVMPATALLDVVKQISEQDGLKDFLSRAAQLATQLTPKASGKTSTPSNGDTAGQIEKLSDSVTIATGS
jgi:hypothetical protein